MKIVFIHRNFPAQYVHAAARLAQTGHQIVCITQRRNPVPPGVRRLDYAPTRSLDTVHEYLGELDAAVRNAQAVARLCEQLAQEGFAPDLVIGHTGWGETLYVKDVWPNAPLLGYFEFFYHATGCDVGFDPEFPAADDTAMRLRTRNAINLLGLQAADWGQTPTVWQHGLYPARDRDRISIAHEGIDTDKVRPDESARLWLSGGRSFGHGDELVTYVSRNLEPYRGFHVFMRALPEILRRRPDAHCVIVGGHGVSYGRPPERAATWRAQMLAELEGQLDLDRIHFLGHLPYRQYLTVLQSSAVHVYMTYPFVLSWSLMEALAAGCHVVASRTPPVEEVVVDGRNGHLVDFFDVAALADRVCDGLRGGRDHRRIRAAARETIRARYDMETICLPAYLTLLDNLVAGRAGGAIASSPPRPSPRLAVGFGA